MLFVKKWAGQCSAIPFAGRGAAPAVAAALALLACAWPGAALAQGRAQAALAPAVTAPTAAAATATASMAAAGQAALPRGFASALAKAKIPQEAVSVWVAPADGNGQPRVAHRADHLMSPASTMKLVTTYAALDQLGPAYTWRTRIYTDGAIDNGSLRGNVYIQGGGDPKLVMERLWLLLRQLQQRGVQVIVGDIVLDRSVFELPAHDAAAFDDEPLRPYNAAPDGLLINFKSVVMRFVPDMGKGVAHVQISPPMAQLEVPATVPLSTNAKTCPASWRQGLRLDVSEPERWRFAGSYPAACGELNWPVAYPDPEAFANKAVEGMWRALGGSLTGRVHAGVTPAALRPMIVEASLSLPEIVRDVNKYSNNVMADHVFLALAGVGGQGRNMRPSDAQANVLQWWERRIGNPRASLVMDNGSGLSRTARVTAHALGRMLQNAWHSAVMPELLSSMPAVGVDGTMRRSRASGSAHIKTGSLRDVNAIAGYVHGHSGRRYVLVAFVNHPNAAAVRGAAFDSLIDWVAQD